MRALLIGMMMLGIRLSATGAQEIPEVDQSAVLRLGNFVQAVGSGPRAATEVDLFAEAMAPPASDADKWFISVLTTRGCGGCEQLKAEWQRNASLLALANPADPKQSWAHYNVYDWNDQSQQFRFTRLKVSVFPTVLVQPPRSGKYGEATVVVYQGVYDGNPERLARSITLAIRQYISKRPQTPAAVSRGIGIGVDPPWSPTPQVAPPTVTPQPPVNPGTDPTIPPATPAVASIGWVTLVWPIIAPAAVAGIAWGVAAIRAKRLAEGKQPLVNQATLDEMLALLKKLAATPPISSKS